MHGVHLICFSNSSHFQVCIINWIKVLQLLCGAPLFSSRVMSRLNFLEFLQLPLEFGNCGFQGDPQSCQLSHVVSMQNKQILCQQLTVLSWHSCLARIRRTQSGNFPADDLGLAEFRRGGLRATAGPRLSRSKDTKGQKR